MKPGTIVVCVKLIKPAFLPWFYITHGPIPASETVTYIVRDCFTDHNIVLIRLEGIVLGWNRTSGVELGAPVDHFREVQLPASMDEQIAELLTLEIQEA
jgi:hypothetical protein